MFKPKPNKLKTEVSFADTSTVFFERMEPKILLSADALSGLVTSDPFNDDAANTALDLGASVDLLSTSYDAKTNDAGSDPVAPDDSLFDLDLIFGDNPGNDGKATSLDALSVILNEIDSGPATRQEIIFVDAATPDCQELLSGINTDAAGTDYRIYILQSDRDGVEQITGILSRFDTVDAVHLVGHGNAQGIQLGDSWLGQDNLADYEESLGAWSNTLHAEADILVYGCNLAVSEEGQSLIRSLGELTGADIAASDDLTGHASLGGDWDLEYNIGTIERSMALSADAQQDWVGLLAGSWFDANTGTPLGGPTTGSDLFVGDAGNDTSINGSSGDDVLYGKDGDDDLTGSSDNDLLVGGAGGDTLTGGSGDDILLGGPGDDFLDGGSGNDILIGDGGNDTLVGGNNDDLFLFTGARVADVYTVDGSTHSDTIDLSEFGAANVTGDLGGGSGTLTVDLGSSQVFTINYSSVENIVMDDGGGSNNQAPQAEAGPDQSVATSSTVTLDASGSIDPDATDTLTYEWQQISGAWVTLANPTTATPTFTAPGSNDFLEFAVIVSDGSISDVDIVQIDVSTNPVNDAPVANNDAFTVNEGSTTTLNLAGNDTDIDGTIDPASIVITGTPANGSIVVNANGTVDYTHNGSETLSDSFTYTILDNSGAVSNTATVNLTVTPVNDSPVANNDTFTVNAGSTTTLNLVANDSDADDGLDLTSIVITGAPTNGSVVVNADGSVDYSHDGSNTVADSFSYTILDNDGAVSNSGTVNVAVTQATGNYLDDFNTVSYNNSSGSLDWSPVTWFEIGDNGNAVSGEIHISGNSLVLEHWGGGDNDIWRIVDLTGATTAMLEFNYTITGDLAKGGEGMVFVWDGFVWNNVATYDLSASVGTTTESLDISAYANAFSAVDFKITTGGGGPTNAIFTIDNVNISVSEGSNNPPTATNLNSTSNYIEGDTVVSITDINVSDDDSGDIITATLTLADITTGGLSANDGASYTASTGVWTITDTAANVNLALANLVFNPNTDNDLDTWINVSIDDGDEDASGPLTGIIDLSVTPVNDAPVANNDTFTVNEGSTTTLNLAANDSDADDGLDLTSIMITAAPANGSITVNADGTVDYTHDGSETLADAFSYTIRDNSGALSNSGTVNISVTPVNDAPTATNLNSTSSYIEQQGTAQITDIVVSDADSGDIITATLTLADTSAGSLSANDGASYNASTGVWTITDTVDNVNRALKLVQLYPNTDNELNSTISVSIDDGDEDASGPLTGTINLNVTPINDAPVANNDAFTVNEGSTTTLNLAANDTDVDSTLDLTSIVITGAPTSGSIVVNADGTVDYTHDGSETLADAFSYTILDDSGKASNSGTVNITVTPVNDAPIVNNDAFIVSEGSTTKLSLAANDTDADDGVDLASITITGSPTNGSITVNADGSVDYTHDGSETLADEFSYTIRDNSGALSNSGTVSISVTPVNDAPVANNDTFTVNEGSTTTLNLAGNDTDVDGNVDLTSIVITAAPASGSITVNADGSVDYTHDGSETLADAFSYTIRDNSGALSNSGTVSISVTPVNDAPVANNDTFTVNEGSTTTLSLAGNDTDVDGNVDLTSIVITAAPANGSITVNADGSVDYTHDGSEALADSFSYTILDNSGTLSNSGTVNISVTPVNDAPVANNDAFIVTEGSTATLQLAANDTDADDGLDLTSIVITGAPTSGSIVVNADGTVDYTHDGSKTLTDSFSYTILDNSGVVSNTGTINLNIIPISVLEALAVTETDVDPSTPDTNNTEDTSSTGDNEDPVKATADENVLNATDEVVIDTSTFTGGVGVRHVLTLPALFQADTQTGEHNMITIRDYDTSTKHKLDTTPIDRLRAQFTGFDGPLQLVASDSFISKLNEASEQIVLESTTFDMVVGGSMSISAGLSVGYAIWLARSGVLMSGLLSSMPAWAFIDPLPVLASMGAKDDDEDDESLESMVEEKKDDE